MTRTLLNRTTATSENALTEEERDAFLTELRIGRLATMREDGWPHVTPIWYVWEDGRFLLTLGKSRRHLRNIARDPNVTLCVDEDPRTTDLTKSPRAVVCFGLATLDEDEADGPRGRRRRWRSATCRRRRGGRSLTSCSGSRAASAVEITPSAGSPGTRERASGYPVDRDLVSCGGAPSTSTLPFFGDHPPERARSARGSRRTGTASAARATGRPARAVALELGRLALLDVAHAEVEREPVEELEQLVVAPGALAAASPPNFASCSATNASTSSCTSAARVSPSAGSRP